ncbi:MAG: right-handed parallel beta-helix repeat-containing protein [Candidatus Thorarchaeota archaeon]
MSADKTKVIGLFLLLVSSMILPNLILGARLTEDSVTATTFLEEAPLFIIGNDDWSDQSWPGSGTELHPYLVENWTLTEFSIGNSDVFVKIQNCIIEVPAILALVLNCIIVNCTFSEPVSLDYCSQIQITNTTFSKSQLVVTTGLTILNSAVISIEECFVKRWGDYGIRLDESTNCIIQGTTFSECGVLVEVTEMMQMSSQSSMYSNPMMAMIDPLRYGGALILDTCTSCTILNNTFVDNIGFGFKILDSAEVIISVNHGINNGLSPTLLSCRDTLVMNNSFPSLSLYTSLNCTLYLNRFGANGLSIEGNLLNHIHTVEQNTVVDRPLLYLLDKQNEMYSDGELGQVFLVNSKHVTLDNIQVSSVINILFSENCKVTDISCSVISVTNSTNTDIGHSNIVGGSTGVYCVYSEETNIHHNTILNTGQGIRIILGSENSIVYSNQITQASTNGIVIEANMCRIENNTITDSAITQYNEHWGIYFYFGGIVVSSHNCTILNNTATDNQGYGIVVSGNNNIIYLNFLARNLKDNALSSGEMNQWDNGVDTGNYWDDWSGSGVYNVPGTEGAVDRFPLGQSNTTNATSGNGLTLVQISLMIISAGSAVIIIVVVYWILKFKRKSV